jgi:predicted MFS family arabinose efflux permease
MASLLRPLRHRDFRLLWLGTAISHTGDWMDTVALAWLVLAIAGTPLALGWLALSRGVPIVLFTLVGGAVADRVDRRRLVLVTQSVSMALAAGLGLLALGDLPPLLPVLAIAAARGVCNSFNIPARQALVPGLVPRDALAAAVALNSATFNVTRAVGPAVGGLVVAAIGPGWAFLANAATFVAAIWSVLAMSPETGRGAPRTAPAGLLAEIGDGIRTVARTPALRAPLALVTLPMILGQPYIALLALVARDVLAAGPSGYGFLVAASAIGSIAGAAHVGTSRPRTWRARHVGAVAAHGLALAVFALSTAYPLSLALVVLVGATSTAAISTAVTRLQEAADDAMRGRVMSLFFLNRGLVPLGTMLGSTLAAAAGVRVALVLMGTAMAALALPVRAAAEGKVRERGEARDDGGGSVGLGVRGGPPTPEAPGNEG